MKFSLFTGLTGISWSQLFDLWKHVEATGWDGAFVTDHFMPSGQDPFTDTLECWTALAALSHITQHIRIGTLVTGNTYRHPAVLAKMAANVDVISEGRLIFGIGAGWQKNEHTAYGIPFYTVGERLNRLEEACQVILELWTQKVSTFEGRYFQLTEAPLCPKPLQKPHPEFLIGGGGVKRTLRIVAKYADHWNDWGGPNNFVRKNPILEEHCDVVGRDPSQIKRSACMPMLITEKAAEQEDLIRIMTGFLEASEAEARDAILTGSIGQIQDHLGRLDEVGVDMLCIPTFIPQWRRDQLDRFISEVAPAFR